MHIKQFTQDNLFSTGEIKDYDVRINGKYFFDQPINNELRTCDIIIKNAIGQGNDHITGCLLDYPYFKKYYQVIAINLSKQQEQEIIKRFLLMRYKRNYFEFFQDSSESIINLFCFDTIT